MKSIFIFRRDIRLTDNTALVECYQNSDKVLPIFIFTPEQTKNNEYFSSNSFQFLLESLDSLDNLLKTKYKSQLHYYYGNNVTVLEKLLKEYSYDSIYFNIDYTPYAIERDNSIKEFCESNNITYNVYEDYLLFPVGTLLKADGKAYEKYTPFKNNAKTKKFPNVNNYDFKINKFEKIKYDYKLSSLKYVFNENLLVHGGRINALEILKNIQTFINYGSERNDLMTSTTHLSAYIKYGSVSIREVFNTVSNAFGINHVLIDQLLWREFYYYLAYYFPRVLQGKSLKEQYDGIKWNNDPKIFEAWTNGNTGFPGVDAGMREMNSTGYMHNRARLITSGILIKILNIDWRLGEKYFARTLIDYDPSVNNGNWQWSSGSGADSQPYFRIMSPWKQVIDNDPDCEYIKKWIPELADVPVKDILNWGKSYTKYKNIKYPKPIVDYEVMRKEIVDVYKKGIYDSK
jgi:deoxyribodipyrimidine photo-lyase